MKIKVNRKEFQTSFQVATMAVSAKKDVTQNSYVLMDTKNRRLTGTDNEIGVMSKFNLQVNTHGKALIPPVKMKSILNNLKCDDITIESTNDGVKVHGKGFRFNLASPKCNAFPEVKLVDTGIRAKVAGSDLRRMIGSTGKSVDANNSKYSISGIKMECFGEVLTLISTDSRRISVDSSPAKGELDLTAVTTIVPVSAARKLWGAINPDDDVSIETNNSVAQFQQKDFVMVARLLSGRFPPWSKVVDRRYKGSIKVNRQELKDLIGQASIVTSKDSYGVDFRFEGDALSVSSNVSEVGSSVVEIPIDYRGDPITSRISRFFAADAVAACGEELEVYFDEPDGSLMFSSDRYQCLISGMV